MNDCKICLIYTGGTIGMRRMENGSLRPPDNPEDFLRVAQELEEVAYDFVPLMNKDSTNITPKDWTLMAEAVHARLGHGYAGFVIAHGTDTMHFSASAVAFCLGEHLHCPVVFTGSQTIPEVSHGDARINLLRAFKVATLDLSEVVIAFGDYVFRACRAQKKDERRFDAFESPAFPPIAYITEDIILSPWARKRRLPPADSGELEAEFAQGIIQVSLIPGLEPDLLSGILKADRCKGVILQSFGAGNVPNQQPFAFTEFIRDARRLHKPLIITSQFPANATLHTSYAPGREAVEAGAIPTGNMTSSCAAAKFRWVLAKVDNRIVNGKLASTDRLREVETLMQKITIDEMDRPSVS